MPRFFKGEKVKELKYGMSIFIPFLKHENPSWNEISAKMSVFKFRECFLRLTETWKKCPHKNELHKIDVATDSKLRGKP